MSTNAIQLMPSEMTSLTAFDVRKRVNLVQEVMRAVMKRDTHYGIIPGSKKETLYKAGSEVLLATFQIAIDPKVEDLSTADEARYRVTTRATHAPTETFLGAGIGEASSEEEKYKWRQIVHENEWAATAEDRRRVKFYRDGNMVKQVRTNVADVANTILKMAKKRSQIDATLTVTGASDIFTQDIEDLPDGYLAQEGGEKTAKPDIQQPKQSQPTGTPISDGQRKRMYAIARDAGFNAEERVKQVIGAYGFEKDTFVTKDKYPEISAALTDKTWVAPVATKQVEKQEAKPNSVEGRVDDVREGKDSHGPFLCLDMGGVELYARDPGMFELLKTAKGKECAFMATVINKEKMRGKIVSILRVGDKEWDSEGLPVIRIDRQAEISGKDAPPAQGMPMDFEAK